jgi:hypothetical protein
MPFERLFMAACNAASTRRRHLRASPASHELNIGLGDGLERRLALEQRQLSRIVAVEVAGAGDMKPESWP